MLSEQHLSWEPRVHFLLVKEKVISSQVILGEGKQFFKSVWFRFIHRENDSGYLPGSSLLLTGLSAPGSCSSDNSLPFSVVSFLSDFIIYFQKLWLYRQMQLAVPPWPGSLTPMFKQLWLLNQAEQTDTKNPMTYLQHRSTWLSGLKTDNHTQDRSCDLFAKQTHHSHGTAVESCVPVIRNTLDTSLFCFLFSGSNSSFPSLTRWLLG